MGHILSAICPSNLGLSEHRKILYISNTNLKPSFPPLDSANWCGHTTSPIATPLSGGLKLDNSLCFDDDVWVFKWQLKVEPT